MAGKLYIIGAGPGDHGLLPVKAAQILKRAKKIFIPVSGEGRESLAYQIVRTYTLEDACISELLFPMLLDRGEMEKAYAENSKIIEAALREGYDAAFITIGDPGTYSTAWQILALLQEHARDLDVEILPGVTSYAAAAARAAVALAEGNDVLSVVSSYDDPERLEAVINASDTVVFLKTYKKRGLIAELLKKKGLLKQCMYIKRCGLEGEEIIRDMEKLPEAIDYFSMIILKKKKQLS